LHRVTEFVPSRYGNVCLAIGRDKAHRSAGLHDRRDVAGELPEYIHLLKCAGHGNSNTFDETVLTTDSLDLSGQFCAIGLSVATLIAPALDWAGRRQQIS
jgi:hypothetical protein